MLSRQTPTRRHPALAGRAPPKKIQLGQRGPESRMGTAAHVPQRVLQLTLAVVKPDAVAHPLILQAVHKTIVGNRFVVVRRKELLWSRQESQRFYQEHSGRFFYQRLVEFMASGPMRAYILAHQEAISLWRSLMGPTKVFRAQHTDPESIRGAFGLTDTRNTVHGSDSAASASREIAFFFPEFSQEDWYRHEEPRLRRESAPDDTKAGVLHRPVDSWAEAD